MRLTESEREELRLSARSENLRSDFEEMRRRRRNPVCDENGRTDPDRFIQFVSQYNKFINHAPKRFEPIITHIMKM